MGDKLSAARVSLIGIELGISVTVGILLGLWLDAKFGTSPWLLIVFLIFGVSAGFRNIYSIMMKAEKDSKEQEKKRL
ncbi:AtpZ/AtpI family protein [Myxococcota bacterium]|nr:AtpZ/AtpI family protein [Myxococcota bacterium]MBU1534193.1 AtpZ/AtpI family protein [Myxococcota bacterium]